MPRREETRHELRCFCTRKPTLAHYGVDPKGKLYVHIKIHKSGKLCGEVIAEGTVRVRCRECLRWHKVVIVQPGVARLEEDLSVRSIAEEVLPAMIAPGYK